MCKCIKHVYDIRYKKRERERELRDRRSNANTRICFEVRAIALRPRLHTEVFPLFPQDLPHRVSPPSDLQLQGKELSLIHI